MKRFFTGLWQLFVLFMTGYKNHDMKHIPILFSTPMVQALLEKRKSQTRRLTGLDKINASPNDWEFVRFFDGYAKFTEKHNALNEVYVKCPYGQPGDVLWVRETWARNEIATGWPYHYKTDDNLPEVMTWKPSIHMPKAACRLWLKVKAVRVERLQEISYEDAIAEGVTYHLELEGFVTDAEGDNYHGSCPIKSYTKLWIGFNGADSWNANPWVWVVEFEPCEIPPDFHQI